jgi:predicted TIM-barrel fold metal-dependent hydrolase
VSGQPRYDVHQHLWPAAVLRELAGRPAPPRIRDGLFEAPGRTPSPVTAEDHALDRRLAHMDAAGIDVALVSLSPTDGFDARLRELWEDEMLKLADASGGRLLPLACRRPRAGFRGVTVAADAVTAGLGSLPAGIAAAEGVLFVHPGPPAQPPPGVPAWWAAAADYAVQMQRALLTWLTRDAAAHPALPVIFTILGGGAPLLVERYRARGGDLGLARHPQVVVDTASFGQASLGQFVAMHGTGQLVHGSDTPVLAPGAAIAALRQLGGDVLDAATITTPGRLVGLR